LSILRRMENSKTKPRAQLDRSAWVLAATELLAKEGVAGLRVELLAKHLKVTKGSFYWHFKDRSDLLQSVLEVWKDGRIKDIVKQTRANGGKELSQLHHVIEVYSASLSRKGMMIELAVRDWARRDEAAAAIVEEVDTWRLKCARELFLACGVPMAEASSRSMLLYAYVFGVSLMFCDRYADNINELKNDIAGLIARSSDTPVL
jgi:AcrR family transcriptional regulator